MKKMRKLIPAFAMLMVAAIMMTTASFAWFTMNDAVTATGMQIKAEAAGALIISSSPLTAAGGEPTVKFDTDLQTLTQITLNKANGAWSQPDTVANGATVDQITGIVSGKTELVPVTITNRADNAYFHDEEVYIGVAGEAKENHKLQLTLTAPVSAAGTATKAYAIAVYVLGVYTDASAAAGAHAGINAVPNAIVYVDNTTVGGVARNTATIDLSSVKLAGSDTATSVVIPSIEGVGEQDNGVTGLKIAIRMFVDGDLASTETTKVTKSVALKAGETVTTITTNAEGQDTQTTIAFDNKYVADRKYYIEQNIGTTEAPVYVEREAIAPEGLDAGEEIPAGWYYYVDQVEAVNVKYVNNQNVPGTGSTLAISFRAEAPASQG